MKLMHDLQNGLCIFLYFVVKKFGRVIFYSYLCCGRRRDLHGVVSIEKKIKINLLISFFITTFAITNKLNNNNYGKQ